MDTSYRAREAEQLAEQNADSVIKEQALKIAESGDTCPTTKKSAGAIRSKRPTSCAVTEQFYTDAKRE